jgi:hypothetical protein
MGSRAQRSTGTKKIGTEGLKDAKRGTKEKEHFGIGAQWGGSSFDFLHF